MPLALAQPVRRFTWSTRQRHRPGLQFMVSTGRHHGFESLAEQRLLLALDFAGEVVQVPTQCLLLSIGCSSCRGRARSWRNEKPGAVTPPGAYGRVFGFVSTGFNIAGIVSPTIFGQLLDHGHPRAMFFFMAACALLAIATVVLSTTRKRAA